MAILTLGKHFILLTMVLAVVGTMCFPCSAVGADNNVNLNAQKIEAGLVYNFLKYTTWPETILSEEKPRISVCLYGDDAFDGYLYPLQGRTAQKYTISIKHIQAVGQLDSCHVVFINKSHHNSLQQIFNHLKGKNILTISNITDFAKAGGMVEFSMGQDKHIHLHINTNSIGTAGLRIEDHLLKLSKVIQ